MTLPAAALGRTAYIAPGRDQCLGRSLFDNVRGNGASIRDLKAPMSCGESHRKRITRSATPLSLRATSRPRSSRTLHEASCGHTSTSRCDQTDQLGRLIDALFETRQTGIRHRPPKLEPFVVAELLQDVALRFQVRARECRVEMHTTSRYRLHPCPGDIELIERAMGNLLENALRYTPAADTCARGCRSNRRRPRARDRYGNGIEPQHLPRSSIDSIPHRTTPIATEPVSGLPSSKRIMDLHGQSVSHLSGRDGHDG